MEPDARFWADKRVCVTGGTGFLGWQLVKQLRDLTPHVRVFGLKPRSPELARQLEGRDCLFGDIRDLDATRQALRNCDVVFHTAGSVAGWGPALKTMREIHVDGTRNVLQALASGARLVHTSSIVAIGATRGPELLTESTPFNLQTLKVDYVHAKKAAEELVLAAAGQGIDAVAVNPGYLIGPDDFDNSLMGRFCVRYWRGRVPVNPPGALNFVDVRDVARGHLLAAERGRRGQRYILGGSNLTLTEFCRALAEVRGMSTTRFWSMPAWLQMGVAFLAEGVALASRREPYPSLHHARMCRYRWHYASTRAEAELGYRARPLRETLEDAHRWFIDAGLVRPLESPPGAAHEVRGAA